MFCIEISKKQIFFFKLAVFYFCDNFAKRTKREQKEMEKTRYFYKIWISVVMGTGTWGEVRTH